MYESILHLAETGSLSERFSTPCVWPRDSNGAATKGSGHAGVVSGVMLRILTAAYRATLSTTLAVAVWPAASVAVRVNSVSCRGEAWTQWLNVG